MDQYPNTPQSNRRRNQTDDPFLLDTPPRQHPSVDTPPPISFTQMLQQPTFQNPIPRQQLFQGQMNPNMFAQSNPYQPNPYQPNPYQPNPYQFHQNMFQYPQHPQSQQQQPPPPPPREAEEPESVPETQAEATPSKRKHKKGKGKAKTTSTTTRIGWVEEEEASLVRAWIASSEDSVKGNAQKGEAFNDRVHAHFHHQMGKGVYRTVDMLTSKWRELLRTCTKFNGIYNNCKRQWASGKGDFDVLTAALTQYRATHNMNGFAHVEAWKVMVNGPKWVLQPELLTSSGSNKRSRTSMETEYTHLSDGRSAPIDLNDDVADDFSDLERPLGRNKARELEKSARSKGKRPSSSSRQNVSNDGEMGFFKDVFTEHLTMSKTKLQLRQTTTEQQKVEGDLRMLSMSTQGIPDENREVIEKVQKSIRERMLNVFK